MNPSLSIFTNKQFQNLAVTHLCTILGTNLLVPVLPIFFHSRGMAETQIGLIMGATAATALIFRPWVGAQADLRGSRPIILVGQLLFILTTIGYWWAAAFWSFLILRLVSGSAMAFYGTGAVTFASSIGTGETNASSIAMYTMITMLGFGFGLSAAQIAYDLVGFDALIGISLALLLTAFAVMKFRASPIVLTGGGSQRASFMAVLRSPIVLAAFSCQFATNFAGGAVLTFMPLASLASGLSFFSVFFISFAVSVFSSRFLVQSINDRFGLEKSCVYACAAMLVSVILPVAAMSYLTLVLSGLLFGIGFGIVFPSLVILLVKRIDKSNRATSLSILIASGDIGHASSTFLMGGIAEHLGYTALFLTTGVVLIACTYGFVRLSGMRPAT